MSRCFVSLRPPPGVVEAVAAVCGGEVPGVRWSNPAEYHVTLRFFPDVDREQLVEAVRTVDHGPVEVEGGPAFREMFDHVVVVPITGVDGLAASVAAATSHLAAVERPFRAHLTVGRFSPEAPPRLEPRPCAVTWRAESVVVVESIPAGGGHEHVAVAEVPVTMPIA